jgi:hypothetical protein
VGFRLRREGQELPAAALRVFTMMHNTSVVTNERGSTSLPLLPSGRYEVSWIARSGPIAAARPVTVDLSNQEVVVTQPFSASASR